MHIGIAQLNPCVGDLDGNTQRALSAVMSAAEQGAELVILPAHALTGAPIDGLATSTAFVEDASMHLQAFAASCAVPTVLSCLCEVEDEDGDTGVVPGIFIAGEGNVDLLGVPELAEEDTMPLVEVENDRIGFLLEEHFAGGLARGDNAPTVLVEMSADAFGEQGAAGAAWGVLNRERTVAAESNAWLAVVNLCGGADRMVFSGNSLVVAPNGDVVYAAPLDAEDVYVFDTADRSTTPAIDPVALQMESDAITWRALAVGTRDYVMKNSFSDVLIGLSGGLDSSVVAALAVDALGSDHVHGLLMPGPYSSEGSVKDAEQLAANLGIDIDTVPIDAPVESLHTALAGICGGEVSGIAAENLQARVRMLYLMTLSNTRGWLVLNTGNKSESAMGFSTLYGDTCGAFAPIGEIYKTDVYDLARWRNTLGEAIPQACIDKAPSAELYPDGVDADRLPPYNELDDLLFDHIESNMDAGELRQERHPANLIGTVLAQVRSAEYKRRVEPLAPKVSGRSLTSDRTWPVTNGWKDNS